MDGGDERLALAFALAAAERLAAPEDAFADARRWSRYVGIVSDDPRAADRYARERDLPQDFFTGERGKGDSLAIVRRQYAADRYVFLGTTDGDRRLADSIGWEYYPVEEAAARAEWELSSTDGALARLAALLGRVRP